jgi:hypothetical protein
MSFDRKKADALPHFATLISLVQYFSTKGKIKKEQIPGTKGRKQSVSSISLDWFLTAAKFGVTVLSLLGLMPNGIVQLVRCCRRRRRSRHLYMFVSDYQHT